MTDHPGRDVLLAILERAAAATDFDTLEHILGCSSCREALAEVLSRPPIEGAPAVTEARLLAFRLSSGVSQEDYPPLTVKPATAEHLSQAMREWAESLGALEEILAAAPERRRLLIENRPRLRTLALAQRLLEASREAAFDSVQEGEALAELALGVLARLPVAVYGRHMIEDFIGRAWSYRANARRIGGDLAGAEEGMAEAARHLEETLDSLEEARFWSLLASLRRDQRRFDQALELLEEAGLVFERYGAEELAARVLVKRGLIYEERGEPEAALKVLQAAWGRLDPVSDPRTAMNVAHNLALCSVETGRIVEAQHFHAHAQQLYERFSDQWSLLRRRWLSGVIDTELGKLGSAEALLTGVRDQLAEEKRDWQAAIVALDLAKVYLKQDRLDSLTKLVDEITPLLFAGDFHREVFVALAMLRKAVARRDVTASLLYEVARAVKRGRR